jgi:hypothetical protein
VTATSEAGAAGPAPLAGIALGLGWQIAEEYRRASPTPGKPPTRQARLPSLSDLTAAQRTGLALAQINATITKLNAQLTAGGLPTPTTDKVEDAYRVPGGSRDALRNAVYDLHLELLRALQAADPNLGAAYRLGKALADTCLAPDDGPSLQEEFDRNRLNNLQEWLADLSSALPPHAARSVAISLEMWQQTIPQPGTASWEVPEGTLSALHRQGKVWRALLTGEKRAEQMLTPPALISAGAELLGQTRRLAAQVVSRYRSAIAATVVLLVMAVLVVVFVKSAARAFTALVPLVAALGLTTRGLIAALRSAAAKVEQPLWEAELDTAVAEVITLGPAQTDTTTARQTAAQLTAVGPHLTSSTPSPPGHP